MSAAAVVLDVVTLRHLDAWLTRFAPIRCGEDDQNEARALILQFLELSDPEDAAHLIDVGWTAVFGAAVQMEDTLARQAGEPIE